MSGPFDFYNRFQGTQSLAVQGWLGGWRAMPLVAAIDPWYRPGELTFVASGAKLTSHAAVPFHTPGLQRFNGAFQFDQNSGRTMSVKRGMWQKGTKINLFPAAEYDISAWTMAPETMSVEIGNNAALSLVYILNGCYSGVPQDSAGNQILLNGQPDPAMTATEQVYFDRSEGKKMAVLEGDTANYRPINPLDLTFQPNSKWFNAKASAPITAPNITAAIKNLQQRKAMNGVELGLGDEGLEIWVPYASKEETRVLIEVFRQLPGVGTALGDNAAQVPVTGGGGLNQVIYSVQDNPVFGRARVRAIHGMRSDLWVVVSPNSMRRPELSMFMYAHGGQTGSYEINPDPAKLMNDTVPHIWVKPWTQDSSMFAGGMPGTQAGDIGITMLVNEGFAAANPILAEFRFTGSAS